MLPSLLPLLLLPERMSMLLFLGGTVVGVACAIAAIAAILYLDDRIF